MGIKVIGAAKHHTKLNPLELIGSRVPKWQVQNSKRTAQERPGLWKQPMAHLELPLGRASPRPTPRKVSASPDPRGRAPPCPTLWESSASVDPRRKRPTPPRGGPPTPGRGQGEPFRSKGGPLMQSRRASGRHVRPTPPYGP